MSVIPTRDKVPQIVRSTDRLSAPGAAPGGGGGMTARDIMRIFLKRKWLILISLAICLAVSIVTTVLWKTYAPLYKAQAYMGVNPPRGTLLSTGTGMASGDIIKRLKATHARMAKSERVLQAATNDQRLRNTVWYDRDRATAVKRLKDKISVTPIVTTNLIEISMTGTDQRDLPVIVNAVAKAFESETLKIANRNIGIQISRLQAEQRNLQTQISQLREKASEERGSGDIPSLREDRSVISVKLNAYTRELMELEVMVKETDEALRKAKQQRESGELSKTPSVQMALAADPVYRQLIAMKINIDGALENAKTRFGPKHPRVKDLEARKINAQAQLKEKEEEITNTQIGMLLSGLDIERSIKTARQLTVQTEFNAAKAKAGDLDKRLATLAQLEGEIEALDKSVGRIESRLLDLRLLSGDIQPPVNIQAEATPPTEPYLPKWSIMIALGFVLGIAVGVSLAFLLEFIDTSINSPSDVSRRIDLPLLGMVPHAEDLEDEIGDLRLAFMTHPSSLIGEAFRQVRTCLLFSGPAEERRTLLVASPMPEDGRTTVATNLAASIAQGGRKAIIVDANFRQPMIRRLFPQCGEAGLSSALVGQANWRDIVREVDHNLFVMPAGPLPPNPADLLGSEAMRIMLGEMSEEYEQVVIDGAPCLVVTDSSVLSTLTDGTLLVVRAGSNTHGVVQRARDMLTRVGAHVLGVVLNGVRVTAGGYLRKNYETFYEYHEQAQLPEPELEDAAAPAAATTADE